MAAVSAFESESIVSSACIRPGSLRFRAMADLIASWSKARFVG